MSTPAAAARYVIAADDKTKSAIASINNGFKSIERGVKGTVKGINTSLSLIAGYGLKRAFQAVFTQTAADSREFATALEDVKLAAKDLLSPADGAPAATAAMRELAETLKDPETVQAANDITTALILGFAKAAEGVTAYFTLVRDGFVGWQAMLGLTGDEVENLDKAIRRIEGQIANRQATLAGATGQFAANLRNEIAALEAQMNQLARLQLKLIEGRPPDLGGSAFGFDTRLPGGELPGFSVGDLNIESELTKQMAEFQRIDNMIAGANDTLDAQLAEFVKSFDSEINSGILDTAQRASDSISEIGDRLGEDILGKTAELSAFAEQAARNMQSAFADFLFDPFQDGMKGMLKGFVDVIRRMIAEAAAAQIFDALFGTGKNGTSGAGNLLGSFLSGLFGSPSSSSSGSSWSGPRYAAGTNFVPRDQLAMVHRGEAIIPAGMNKGGMGGVTFAPVYNIDARGATQDAIKALPEVLKRNNDALEARIVQRLRSGKYG